ncbi:MAG: tRNA preQ1(34) S-adenosylmethionine ribosyltransferase-isomerase QueA [Clostridia bacterium]
MKKSEFYYDLPEELIAQTPIEPRDMSRMLTYHMDSKVVENNHFFDLPKYLKKGDILVVNNTKVIPARLFGQTQNGGKVEVLLLKRIDLNHFETLVKPGKKFRMGSVVTFSEELSATVVGTIEDIGGRILEFKFDGVLEDILDRIGSMPLPPYIHEKLKDKDRYQTVYAKDKGSSAAPTAGLHFTPELLEKIKEMGVEILEVTLNVGLGTFRPVKEDDIEKHPMHSEYYSISAAVAEKITQAKSEKRRIIAVGTTSVRVLEATYQKFGKLQEFHGDTDIFIYPPFEFKVVDCLITNFHLPESTLVMLVSALIGREKTLELYNYAVKEKYRFFSFGDSTFFVKEEV